MRRLAEKIREIARRVKMLSRREGFDRELDEEMGLHRELRARESGRDGIAADDARYSAQRRFGNSLALREESRDMWGWNWLEDLFQDLRFGLRVLRKSPGFTLVVVATLALGIGANTAIFSVVYAVLLKPLPYANPDQLVGIFEAKPQEGIPMAGCSYSNLAEWREQTKTFSELAGTSEHDLTLTGRGDPSVVRTVSVTPEMFALLGTQPLLGRGFRPEEGKEGAAPVVVLSENLWRSRFAADPKIIGSAISLDKRSFTVVGVMRSDFRFPILTESEAVWIPVIQDPLFGPWTKLRGVHLLRVVGRLKPGVSMAQAQAEMDAIQLQVAREFPAENAGWTIRITPLQRTMVGNAKSALLVLLGAVGLVLLIACANIANLLLARATSRAKEMAVRIALGAARTRILRQLLTESFALGLLGGAAGACLGYWGVAGLSSLLPPDLPHAGAIAINGWVLGFALALSAAASFIFGLAPALFAADANLQANLKEGSARSGESRRGQRLRGSLAVGEIALAMVLLVAAGLLVRSFAALSAVSPGFQTQHVLNADISLPRFQYSTPQQWTSFSNELLARVQAAPGLQKSAVGIPLPIVRNAVNLKFDIAGEPSLSPGTARMADYVSVSPDYFRVMGIPLLRGRPFQEQDSPAAPRVTIISEAMARLYFPGEDALGKRLIFAFHPDNGFPHEIVGIVADIRDGELSSDPRPMMYVPFAQAPFWGVELVVKSDLSPSSVAAAIRQEVRNIDPDLPVTDIGMLSNEVEASVAQPKFRTVLFGLFGAMALLLAAAGIFGVISYWVSSRTHEIGIRVALGATPGDVLRLILTQGMRLTAAGILIGLAGAFGVARYLATLLYGVTAHDPFTLAGVALGMTLVSALACWIPARRATRVDPLVALKYE